MLPLEQYESGKDNGGVVVRSRERLTIYKSTFRLFEFSKGLEVNKNTRFQVTELSENIETSICFYESMDEIEKLSACQELKFVDKVADRADFKLGKIIDYKKTTLHFMAVKQNSISTTEFLDFTFVEELESLLFDESGNCIDPNAETKWNDDGTAFCQCNLEYVSSNGGRNQGEIDQCVPCEFSEFCSFEGEACLFDDDCDRGICNDNICATSVSYHILLDLLSNFFAFLTFPFIFTGNPLSDSRREHKFDQYYSNIT